MRVHTQEVAKSVPDMVRRVGDGSNNMLVEQEMQMAFQTSRLPVMVFTMKDDPNLMLKSVAAKLQPGTLHVCFLSFLFVSKICSAAIFSSIHNTAISLIMFTNPTGAILQKFNNAPLPGLVVLMPQNSDAGPAGQVHSTTFLYLHIVIYSFVCWLLYLFLYGQLIAYLQQQLRVDTYLPGIFGPMKFMSVVSFLVQGRSHHVSYILSTNIAS